VVKIRNVYGDEYKGRQGNAVYQKFYGRQIRRLWDGKKENKAPQQEEQKKRFKMGLAFWESLSTEEREKLKEYLRGSGSDLTAQQWAVKVALVRPRVVIQEQEVLANLVEWVSGWDAIGWPYRQAITITNSNSTDLTDYQVRLELTADNVGANFDWSRQGADLRFYDNDGNKLSYWVEEWDKENKTAKVWVKVPQIPAGGSTSIKMYYGNAQAESESDGEAVFEFFDDFKEDTGRWTLIGANSAKSYEIADSILHLKRLSSNVSGLDEAVYTATGDLTQVTVEAKMKISKSVELGITGLYFFKSIDTGAHALVFGATDNGNFGVSDWNFDGSGVTELYEFAHEYNEYHIWTVKKNGNSYTLIYDGEEKTTITRSTTPLNDIGFGVPYNDNELWVDWVRIRKYAEQEPAASFGDEEVGQVVMHGKTTITVKAIESEAIQEVKVFDSDGAMIWSVEGLTDVSKGKITSRVTLPQEAIDKGVRALVRSAAGTVDIVNL